MKNQLYMLLHLRQDGKWWLRIDYALPPAVKRDPVMMLDRNTWRGAEIKIACWGDEFELLTDDAARDIEQLVRDFYLFPVGNTWLVQVADLSGRKEENGKNMR